MLGLSAFDILSSVTWIVSTAALPTTVYGVESDVYGAAGSEATCLAKALFVELGMIGSAFYNLSLSVYYVFMIVWRRRQSQQLRRLSIALHALPIVLALTLSLGGLPHYEKTRFCHIAPPFYNKEEAWKAKVFVVVPLALVIVVASANMAVVYVTVRKRSRASARWRFDRPSYTFGAAELTDDSFSPGEGPRVKVSRASLVIQTNQSERAVFWKGFFYLLSFLFTWPFYMASMIFFEELSDKYGYWVVSYFFQPLQGFLNCLVYFTPVAVEYIEKRRILRRHSLPSHPESPEASSIAFPREEGVVQGTHPSADEEKEEEKNEEKELQSPVEQPR